MSDLHENFLQAMNIIADQVAESLPRDYTITCTIVDNSNREQGAYVVTDGASKFTVYSDNHTYSNKTQVFVSVPNGDFTQQKMIIGKKVSDSSEPFIYYKPFDTFIQCTDNLCGEEAEAGIVANGEFYSEGLEDSAINANILQYYKGFTRLGIRANFRSWLRDYYAIAGTWGLLVRITGKYIKDTASVEYVPKPQGEYILLNGEYIYVGAESGNYEKVTEENKVLNYFLSSKDMIGNPYSFIDYTQQEITFDISNLESLSKIEFFIYQEKDFQFNEDYPKEEKKIKALQPNLFVKNVELYLGYDASEMEEDEFLKLYCFQPMTYNATNDDNLKKVRLRWGHKVGNKWYSLTEDNIKEFILDYYAKQDTDPKFRYLRETSETRVVDRDYYYLEFTGDNSKEFEKNQTVYDDNYLYYYLGYDTQTPDKIVDSKKYIKKLVPASEDNLPNSKYYYYVTASDITFAHGVTREEAIKNANTYWTFGYEKDDEGSYFYGYYLLDDLKSQDKLDKYTELYKDLYRVEKIKISEIQVKEFDTIEDENKNEKEVGIIGEGEGKKSININELYYKEYYEKYEIPSDIYEIRWYHYSQGAPSADQYSGVYWEAITEDMTKDYYKVNDFLVCLKPDCIYNKEEQIKAILLLKNQEKSSTEEKISDVFYSDPIVFTNEGDVIDLPTLQEENALRFKFQDSTMGNYYLYDESNTLIDKTQSQIVRSIRLLFDLEDYTSNSQLTGADWVEWKIPKQNSMISMTDVLNNDYTITSDENYYYYKSAEKLAYYDLNYKIVNYFGFNKNNNTIICTISKDGSIYSANRELSFGQSGSNGSDYTLALDLLTSDGVITLDQTSNVFSAKFEQIDGFDPNQYKEKFRDIYYKDSGNANYMQCTTVYDLYQQTFYKQSFTTLEYSEVGDEVIDISKYRYFYKRNNETTYHKAEVVDGVKNIDGVDVVCKVINKIDRTFYRLFKDFKILFIKDGNNNYVENDKEFSEGTDYYIKTGDNEYTKFEIKSDEDKKKYFENKPMGEGKKFYKDGNNFKEIKQSDIKVQATLYDQQNHKVNLPDNAKITWSWGLTPNAASYFANIDGEKNAGDMLALVPTDELTIDSICILTATLTGFGDYDLVAHLPLPLRNNFGPTRFQGPTQIIYSTTGVPNYYKDEINVFYNETDGEEKAYPISTSFNNSNNITTGFTIKTETNQEIDLYPKLVTTETRIPNMTKCYYDENKTFAQNINALSPNVIYYELLDNGTYSRFSKNAKEILSSQEENEELKNLFNRLYYDNDDNEYEIKSTVVKLQPTSMYIAGLEPFAIQYKYNGQVIWTQPILNIQNQYFSSTINKWDGALSIDEDKNTILAKMIGAGRKNSQNKFSGVVMGDWTGSVNKNDGSKVSLANKLGIYGFHEGETSFGFTEDGLGFIGKAGKGRILLDGNNSVITSENWSLTGSTDSNHSGLYMDIDDGFILMRDRANGDHYIKLNAFAIGDPVKGGHTSGMSYADDNPQPGIDPETNQGIDIQYPFVIRGNESNFTAIGWNGNLLLHGTHTATAEENSNNSNELKGNTGYINLNACADNYPIDLNNRFGVNWDGSMIITENSIFNSDSAILLDKVLHIHDDTRDGSGHYYEDNDTKNILKNYWGSPIDPKIVKDHGTNNPYDYSQMESGFFGLFATPKGDLYLSNKLIIGQNFSATRKGYIKAKSALFEQSLADTFDVCILNGSDIRIPADVNGGSPKDDPDPKKYEKLSYSTDLSDNSPYRIGKMGWITGSSGEGDDMTTVNLGISSNTGYGIKLDSKTNMSLSADKGIFNKSANYLIDTSQYLILKNENTENKDNIYNGIILKSTIPIKSFSKEGYALFTGVSDTPIHLVKGEDGKETSQPYNLLSDALSEYTGGQLLVMNQDPVQGQGLIMLKGRIKHNNVDKGSIRFSLGDDTGGAGGNKTFFTMASQYNTGKQIQNITQKKEITVTLYVETAEKYSKYAGLEKINNYTNWKEIATALKLNDKNNIKKTFNFLNISTLYNNLAFDEKTGKLYWDCQDEFTQTTIVGCLQALPEENRSITKSITIDVRATEGLTPSISSYIMTDGPNATVLAINGYNQINNYIFDQYLIYGGGIDLLKIEKLGDKTYNFTTNNANFTNTSSNSVSISGESDYLKLSDAKDGTKFYSKSTVMVQGETTAQVTSPTVVLSAGSSSITLNQENLEVTGVRAENQHGIYARFA